MKNVISEKFYQKYAWVIFIVIGGVVAASGLLHAVGFNTDPKLVQTISDRTIDELKLSDPKLFNLYDFYFSGGGLSDLGFSFFLILISLNAYKKGQRWAWYAFCFVPIYFLTWIAISFKLPVESRSSLLPPLAAIIISSLVGLFLPFRNFFPDKKEEKMV